jgi:oligopeptide/dipeptide ABC transporter ATP-binding protein
VTYGPEGPAAICALDEARLEIHPGEVVGILGESGSGKSTLAAALMGLLPVEARCERRAIQFRDLDLRSLTKSEMRRVRGTGMAMIPQDPALALNPVMQVGTQVSEVLRAHTHLNTRKRRQGVTQLLEEVGFEQPDQIYHAYPHQLSGGQRQRVVIAQAMACRPALVIADEPTSKLDARLQAEILGLMREIGRRHDTAFVLISHDPTVFVDFADRIAVMYAGRVVEEGRARDMFRRPLHPYTQALMRLASRYLAAPGIRARFPALSGDPPGVTHANVGCPFAPRCPERMQVCTERDPGETVPEPARRVNCFKYEQ